MVLIMVVIMVLLVVRVMVIPRGMASQPSRAADSKLSPALSGRVARFRQPLFVLLRGTGIENRAEVAFHAHGPGAVADLQAGGQLVARALLGALANGAFALLAHGVVAGMAWRFATGFALAGIYPLGMKLVVGWAPGRAGETLGWLVGMLTIGTALPHAIRAAGSGASWQAVVLTASALALVSGAAVVALGGVIAALAVPSFLGGFVGATLLLRTKNETFAALVPYLILLATCLFMIQGPVNRWLRRRAAGPRR
mgnify:CR=1 FL=1